MILYNCLQKPIKMNGLLGEVSKGNFHKMPEDISVKISETVNRLGRRATGGRIRFSTNSRKIKIEVDLLTLKQDINFCIKGSAGCAVLAGIGKNTRFLGMVSPVDYTQRINAETFDKGNDLQEDITIYLPRNELVNDVNIWIDEDAQMYEPSGFAFPLPIVFYGSSITEGCTTVNSAINYPALVCRWLNCDFVNFGFSGAAKGEASMAEYIKKIPMSLFVMDYDHNAPDTKHLENTHYSFYETIRKENPNLPILFMSSPVFGIKKEEFKKRRDIVRNTYINALNNNDKKVSFLDGHDFFEESNFFAYTVDNVHPNDTGLMLMAQKVYKAIEKMI